MRTKNLTPHLFGFKVTSRQPPKLEMTAVVRACLRLRPGHELEQIDEEDQGFLTSDTYLDDDSDRIGGCVYPGDFADFKPNADVMLRGRCYPPGGRRSKMCPVRFSVGRWCKELLVLGPREWKKGLLSKSPGDPKPFDSLPLDWRYSFGGEGYAANPVGQGYGDSAALPQIEAPEERLRSGSQKMDPTNFGPINPAWPQRAKKRGKKYGKRWKAEREPWYSEDFDWTHFNCAPEDQQLPEYLRGNERVNFKNLHKESSDFGVKLPGTRVRVFYKDDNDRFREIPMVLDTLFADLEEEKLYLTWRGLGRVSTEELKDVTTALIAEEQLDEEPLDAGHYRKLLEDFAEDPLGLSDMPQDMQDDFKAIGELQAAQPGPGPLPKSDSAGAAVEAAAKLLKSTVAPREPQGAKAVAELLEKGAAVAKAGGKGDELQRQVAEALSMAGQRDLPGAKQKLGAVLGDMKGMVGRAQAQMDAAGTQPELVKRLQKVLDDPRLAKLEAFCGPDAGADGQDEPAPGAQLAGRDFSRQDLSGLDLSGANLERAILSEAILVGTRLRGCNLKEASLHRADLSQADFSEADLETADFSRALARGARFEKATMKQTDFSGADLSEAVFDGASGIQVQFNESCLVAISAVGIELERSDLTQARLDDAVLQEAKFTSVLVGECKAERLDLRGATLDKTSFAKSELTHADLSDTQGERTVWNEVTLTDCDLSYSRFPDAFFPEAQFRRVKLQAADLRNAHFRQCSMDQVNLSQANLFSADFSKASLSRVRFNNASAYDAKFYRCEIKRCDFTGANLERALIEKQ